MSQPGVQAKIEAMTAERRRHENVPLDQRSEFIERMLTTPQGPPAPPKRTGTFPEEGHFEFSGFRLHYHVCRSADPPRALLLNFHGLNSSGASAAYFLTRVAAMVPVHAYSLDFMNFGQSGGEHRGFIESVDSQILQAEAFLEHVRRLHPPAIKVFLTGLSLGGLVAFHLAVRQPQVCSGLIMLSPALKEVSESQKVGRQLARMLGWLFPRMQTIQQSYENGNRNNKENYIRNDPHSYTGRVIPGSIRAVLNGMEAARGSFSALKTPYLLVQSSVDKLVDVFAPIDLEKASPATDKTTLYVAGMWHGIYLEDDVDDVVEVTADWLLKRL